MIAYTFVNSYICGIQVGIQAGHALVDFMAEHSDHILTKEWVCKHKTFIWLDGGDMVDVLDKLSYSDMPYSAFEEPGLGNTITAATVVLSEAYVAICDRIRKVRSYDVSLPDEDGKLSVSWDGGYTIVDEDRWPILELIIKSRLKSL